MMTEAEADAKVDKYIQEAEADGDDLGAETAKTKEGREMLKSIYWLEEYEKEHGKLSENARHALKLKMFPPVWTKPQDNNV